MTPAACRELVVEGVIMVKDVAAEVDVRTMEDSSSKREEEERVIDSRSRD